MKIQTVNREINANNINIVDAHVHIWAKQKDHILKNNFPEVDDFQMIRENLLDFNNIGGKLVVDCTPCGCGRDGNILRKVSIETGVEIACITGFHRREYYISDSSIWNFNQEEASLFFLKEITEGLKESISTEMRIKPCLIKIPFLGFFDSKYKILTDAAIFIANKTGLPVLIHTEKGINVEWFSDYLEERGIKPQKVVFSHMDKRPDFKLHKKLASRGYYLEYDTFLREEYEPDKNIYELIDLMIRSGFTNSIMVGSDIFNNIMWKNIKEGTSYGGFFLELRSRLLKEYNFPKNSVNILGKNAARFLSKH